ncbi:MULTISPECIES: succinate dehydrogenase assembly factor 2 [unclassified Rhodosalinus]|uniref:FAD assembly factor SdhE n=1 Tax=unclassified Rhodosalinus TaxID=2630183 RepID=UPI003523CD99
MTETAETRRRRLSMRSMRRGTKEMDLILQGFAEARLAGMDDAALDAYEALLEENDQDLYAWVAGQSEPPARHAPLIGEIRARLGMAS